MATLKAIVKTKMRNGMYKVYIRFTHNRQFSYMRTSWMVNEKGLSDDNKDIIDPFVIQQTSILIEECYNKLNQVDIIAKTKCAFFQNEMCIFCIFFAVSQLVLNGLLNGF